MVVNARWSFIGEVVQIRFHCIPHSASMTSSMLTPPETPQGHVAVSMRSGTTGFPGAKGFQFTAWSNEGNMPNMAEIFGSPGFSYIPMPYPVINEDPYNKLFIQISKEIVTDWKNVGRFLQLGEYNINIIDNNNLKIEDKSYSMLLKWRELFGNSARKDVLIKALVDSELKRVAEIVQEFTIPDLGDQPGVAQDEDSSDVEIDGIEDYESDDNK